MRRKKHLDQDFQDTFGTESGKRVLMHLYKELGHEFHSTFPADGNTSIAAFNEGRRSVWVLIARRLRKTNEQLRRMWDESEESRIRESEL